MMIVRPEIVALALSNLRSHGMHANFPGYLCMKLSSRRQRSRVNLKPDFKAFFDDYLALPGGPPERPYIRFTEASDASLWFNSNVAGSYAPSSLRPDNPFRRVVKVGTGTGARYSLKSSHAKLALKHLAGEKPVPVLALSIFLYRDYALRESANPGDWVSVFREEFGYPQTQAGEREFRILFDPLAFPLGPEVMTRV